MQQHILHFSKKPITKSSDLFLWDWFRFRDISQFLQFDSLSLSRFVYRAIRDAVIEPLEIWLSSLSRYSHTHTLSLLKEVKYAICLKEKALFGDCTSPLKLEKNEKT